MKWLILFPFLPIKWAWRWSAGAAVNGSENGFAHIIGFLIIAGILYSAIGWGLVKILAMCGVVM